MSRGPGSRQQAILAAVAEYGAVGVTHPDDSESEKVASRRAAYALETAGKIALTSVRVDGRPRLVAYPIGSADFSGASIVIGLDGKRYRQPKLGG